MTTAALVEQLLGADLPVRFESYDGSSLGPPDAPATVVVRSPDALSRLVTAPGELGFARAYVAGDIEVEGDLEAVLRLRDRLPDVRLTPRQWATAARLAGRSALRRLPPPPEERRLHGRRHTKARDAAAVRHHYDVSNRFYEVLLGPSLTYSCAVFPTSAATLEAAQEAKHELICAKLGLRPGMRLLDVGCGWGSMVIHAAATRGVRAVGITLSPPQADLARKRVADAGLSHLVAIRVQDYRDVDDGPYDAMSSIGMFEHVGASQLAVYLRRLHALLRPEGRLLNHGISRPAGRQPRIAPRTFLERYVFPDGELHEVGTVVSAAQEVGFEARHLESLREHYARTCRAWVANLEAGWDEAVAEAGLARARIWRLYLTGSAMGFEEGRTAVHQLLAVRSDGGRSGMPLRPDW